MWTAAVVRKFRKERPNLNESPVQTFAKKCKDELKLAAQEKRAPKRKIYILKRGKIDELMRSYL